MGIEKIDITGVHRTHAVFLIAAKTVSLKSGDIMEVTGTSPTFREDMRSICRRIKKTPMFLETGDAGMMKCEIHF